MTALTQHLTALETTGLIRLARAMPELDDVSEPWRPCNELS